MKSSPEPAVLARIDAMPGATLFLSAVTQAEILYGLAPSWQSRILAEA